MAEPSKDLLDPPSKPSFIETLLVGKGGEQKESKRKVGPLTNPLPKSQVLGKVKGFLGEIAKANEKLQLDAQNKSPEEYNIEVLNGSEQEYIQMDLLLGIADLHSEQAVEAAEATMSGFPPSDRPFTCSSSDSQDDSYDSDEDDGHEQNMPDEDNSKDSDEAENSSGKGKRPNNRAKIVVLSS